MTFPIFYKALAAIVLVSTFATLAGSFPSTGETIEETGTIAIRASRPAVAGDAAAGHKLALKLCWACHVVASDQEFKPMLDQPAPAFRRIASKPGITASSLRHFLETRHQGIVSPSQMPNPELTDEQIADIVSFMMTLRHDR